MLTLVPGERLLFMVTICLPQVMQTEVRDLDHKPAVNHTVGTFQVSMATDFGAVKVGHALKTVSKTLSLTTETLPETDTNLSNMWEEEVI